MAQRFLAIDWDQNQLHLVAGSVSGGAVRFHQAARIETDASPNPASAVALGKLLTERLKELGIAGAPVLACLGRDRVILKEVRFPSVPAHEEPGVVRFQAVKEMTDNPDDVYIDYTTLPSATPGGEKRAQVMIARKEIVNAYRTLCESAGLKLAGIAPRAHGMAACLARLMGTSVLVPPPEPPDSAVALVTVGEKWAEFCILKGDQLLQARSLGLGAGLAGEIRRNIAVFAGQHSDNTVKAVYLALSGEQAALREKLVQILDVPVHPFDPFAGAEGKELPTSGRGTSVGAVGLLHLMAQKRELPVNFAQAKQIRAPKDPNQRSYVLAACLILVLLVGGFLMAQKSLADKREALREAEIELSDQTKNLAVKRDERLVLQALHDWETVNWADEFYEFATYMPRADRDFRVTKLDASTEKPVRTGPPLQLKQQREKPPPKLDELVSRAAARLLLKMTSRGEAPLAKLTAELEKAKSDKQSEFYRPKPHKLSEGSYTKEVSIFKRPPDHYTQKIPPK